MLCFIDFCIALHNCSNARVRYGLTCMYSSLRDRVVVAAGAVRSDRKNFVPHFITLLNGKPFCVLFGLGQVHVLLSTVIGKYFVTYELKQIGIPCMKSKEDQIGKTFVCRNGISKNKSHF